MDNYYNHIKDKDLSEYLNPAFYRKDYSGREMKKVMNDVHIEYQNIEGRKINISEEDYNYRNKILQQNQNQNQNFNNNNYGNNEMNMNENHNRQKKFSNLAENMIYKNPGTHHMREYTE